MGRTQSPLQKRVNVNDVILSKVISYYKTLAADDRRDSWSLSLCFLPVYYFHIHVINFGDSRQVRTCRTEAFFSKLLCLAQMSRNVTKRGQHG